MHFFPTQNQRLMAESLANFSASSSARYRLFPQFPTEFSNRKWKITLSTESFQGRYITTATISDQKDTVCYPLSDRAADTPHSLLHNVKNALHCVLNSVKFFGRAHPVSPLIYSTTELTLRQFFTKLPQLLSFILATHLSRYMTAKQPTSKTTLCTPFPAPSRKICHYSKTAQNFCGFVSKVHWGYQLNVLQGTPE